jgi:hypothetical protein
MKHKPLVSPNFTMEDIRKLRDYDYEITKNMTPEERISYHRAKAENVYKEMADLRDANDSPKRKVV